MSDKLLKFELSERCTVTTDDQALVTLIEVFEHYSYFITTLDEDGNVESVTECEYEEVYEYIMSGVDFAVFNHVDASLTVYPDSPNKLH